MAEFKVKVGNVVLCIEPYIRPKTSSGDSLYRHQAYVITHVMSKHVFVHTDKYKDERLHVGWYPSRFIFIANNIKDLSLLERLIYDIE